MFLLIFLVTSILLIIGVKRYRTPDCGDGYIHKVLALLGIELPHFERIRFEHIVSQHQRNDDTDERTLCVAFAGGAVRIGGLPRAEFRQTLTSMGTDALFLVDTAQRFYTDKVEQLRDKIATLKREFRYTRTVMIGSCMGGSGALRFADLADCVLAFVPPVDLKSRDFFWYRVGGLRLESRARHAFADALLDSVSRCRGAVHCYFAGDDVRWHRQADILLQKRSSRSRSSGGSGGGGKVRVHMVPDCTSPVQHFKRRNQLLPLIRLALEGDGKQLDEYSLSISR
jgi:hypothetical protein